MTDPGDARALDRAVDDVLARRACSGCGACTLLDPGLAMALDADGFARPHRAAPSTLDASEVDAAVRTFAVACPGVRVSAVRDAPWHPTLGPVLAAWQAWATDPQVRHAGSSGGALTALAAWLVETGEAPAVVGTRAGDDPRRTVSVRITTRAQALESAGSRYAPVSACAAAAGAGARDAVVGKPCEVGALRAIAGARGEPTPLLLSFFCAGTPSQHATDSLVERLGVPAGTPLAALRYRGDGWPGRFVARTAAGQEVSASYDESWGKHLGPTVQWRCKICPDGVGESSDVTAGDFWRTDERGYPAFAEDAGVSALLARTPRGLDLVERAVAAGVIVVEPIDPDDIAAVQPLQRTRRATLLGRLVGARLGGLRPPRYLGFGLLRLALADPRQAVRTARGTVPRARAARAGGTR